MNNLANTAVATKQVSFFICWFKDKKANPKSHTPLLVTTLIDVSIYNFLFVQSQEGETQHTVKLVKWSNLLNKRVDDMTLKPGPKLCHCAGQYLLILMRWTELWWIFDVLLLIPSLSDKIDWENKSEIGDGGSTAKLDT